MTNLEKVNARFLNPAELPRPAFDAVVMDLSFISLSHVLPAIRRVAAADADIVLLVKPQFEVGPEAVGKGGIVRDATAQDGAVRDVARFLAESGWTVLGTIASPIAGGDGNREFLIAARKR